MASFDGHRRTFPRVARSFSSVRNDLLLIALAVGWFVMMMDYYTAADRIMEQYVKQQLYRDGIPADRRKGPSSESKNNGKFGDYTFHNGAAPSESEVLQLKLMNQQAALDLSAAVSWGDFERAKQMGKDLSERLNAAPQRLNKVVIATMTRDDFAGLQVNRWQIEELGKLFDDYRVLIYENDSAPSFRASLNDWARANHKVRIVSEDFNLKKRPNLSFLAKLRNIVLDHLQNKEYDDFDRVILVDLDVSHRWPVQDIAGSTLLPWNDFGVRCFNVYTRHGGHRDALALRSKTLFPFYKLNQPWSVNRDTIEKINDMTKAWAEDKRNVLVDSCFGGLAAYSMQVMRECRYDETREECEHIAFNECIRSKQKTVVLDLTVGIKFHYREFKEGRPLLWVQDLPMLIAIAVVGAARYLTRDDMAINTWTFRRLRFLVLVGVSTETWFCFLAKDSDAPAYLWTCAALLAETVSTFIAIHLYHRYVRGVSEQHQQQQQVYKPVGLA